MAKLYTMGVMLIRNYVAALWCLIFTIPAYSYRLLCTEVGLHMTDSEQLVAMHAFEEIRNVFVSQTLGTKGEDLVKKCTDLSYDMPLNGDAELALEVVDRVLDKRNSKDLRDYLFSLPFHRRWSLYLITGYYSLSTHTESHRKMVDLIADWLTRDEISNRMIYDVGLGLANLGVAAMLKDPHAIVRMLDITEDAFGFGSVISSRMSSALRVRLDDPIAESVGRLDLSVGSATDPIRFPEKTYDSLSAVLTRFAIPDPGNEVALNNMIRALKVGGIFAQAEPLQTVNDEKLRRGFIKRVVLEGVARNPFATVFDVVKLVVQNDVMLKDTPFKTPEQQVAEIEAKGLELIYQGFVFTDNAYLTVWKKSKEFKPKGLIY